MVCIETIKKGSESLIYFGAVAELNPVSFARRSSVETEAEFKQDLRNQAFVLAKGLRSKFIKLKIVGYLFIAQFVLSIPLIINIINNFKSTK